ncbi:hypothetical protein LAZ67_15001939 [Cordylochernes scorpioides]|uniref:GAF domain-containing protein n=1 Tax=Cordylochernes scorpioides TaxID=51811 RepID=A0ABY6L969_9ARAC|nr:hypothetical protein LAZ67_15001939 [Cordylochernes scorpioides]
MYWSLLVASPKSFREQTEKFEWSRDSTTRSTLASYVSKTREAIRIKASDKDSRFPDGIRTAMGAPKVILCHPIIQPDGDLLGVLELYRFEESEFYEEDEEIVNSYLVWGGIALHYAELYTTMAKQRKLNNFLLTVVRSIFQDMVSMDSVIVKIMLVNADRASLFLVDCKTKELYARIFDVSGGEDENGTAKMGASKEISVPKLYNIKRHYEQHKSKYDTYEGLMRQEKLKEFKLGMKKQQFMFTKVSQESEAAVHASYVLSDMIAKHSKPFTEGDFIKEYLIKAAEIVCPGSV